MPPLARPGGGVAGARGGDSEGGSTGGRIYEDNPVAWLEQVCLGQRRRALRVRMRDIAGKLNIPTQEALHVKAGSSVYYTID